MPIADLYSKVIAFSLLFHYLSLGSCQIPNLCLPFLFLSSSYKIISEFPFESAFTFFISLRTHNREQLHRNTYHFWNICQCSISFYYTPVQFFHYFLFFYLFIFIFLTFWRQFFFFSVMFLLTWNSLCRPSWLRTHRNIPDSAV